MPRVCKTYKIFCWMNDWIHSESLFLALYSPWYQRQVKITLQIKLWLYLVLSGWIKWSMQLLPLIINILRPLDSLHFLLLFHFLYPAYKKVWGSRVRASSCIHSGSMLQVDHFASNNSLVYVCTYRIWLIQR